MLKTNPSFRGFLPTGTQVGVQVQGDFAAGDDRLNENPTLAVMHNGIIVTYLTLFNANYVIQLTFQSINSLDYGT